MTRIRAVIFDVDGTLAETEEAHRTAFNEMFSHFGLDWTWDCDLYRELLKVTGGKERMRHYAERKGLSAEALQPQTIADMHAVKTECYVALVAAGQCPLRVGVEKAIRHASEQGVRLAIATTTSHANVDALLTATLGPEGKDMFEVIAAGDDVPRKKPAPDVYHLALKRLGLAPSECVAIEDSANGVAAARAAGLDVWVTPSVYTSHESFERAARVLPDLEDFARLLAL